MAIKAISQLDQFDNKTEATSLKVGGELQLFANPKILDAIRRDDVESIACSASKNALSGQTLNLNTKYYGSLFEISKPIKSGQAGLPTGNPIYNSQKITYQDLAKNLILDVKSYLNTRNNLNSYNLADIVSGDYHFYGNKTFTGNLSCNGNLSVDNWLIAQHLSAGDAKIYKLAIENWLSIECDISAIGKTLYLDDSGFLSGYAYGLKDNKDKSTTIPETANSATGFDSLNTKNGNPVWFYEGRPYELSSVQRAKNAEYIVDANGNNVTCGNGGFYDGSGSIPENLKNISCCPVYIKDGRFLSSNIIEYAKHAFWADLGEKYLADAELSPGTLVEFGGSKEITVAKRHANAIVSTNAFDLNSGLKDGTVIALCGRVPTKVVGKIQKFQKIVLSNIPGVARARRWYDFFKPTIGRSLASNDNAEIKLVECATRFVL